MMLGTSRRVALLLVLAALAAMGCGDDDGEGEGVSTTTASTSAARPERGWHRVEPGGDCQCSDGSEFNFWVRRASPKKVVLYLQGGGACFSAETCAPEADLYTPRVDAGPMWEGGILDFAEEQDPFADYSVVYVPYCTGDVHIGNTTVKYANGLTIQHKGYVNGTAALNHLAKTYPDATNVVVIGESAGSVAAPLYAGLAADRLPRARVTVLADGSGSYPDVPSANRIITAWARNSLPHWAESGAAAAERFSFPGLITQSGRHDPRIVFARHDHAYDSGQKLWYPIAGIPAEEPLPLIDRNESEIEDAGVNLLSYVAPGDRHTVLTEPLFYTEEVNGRRLVDWVTRVIQGKPVDDVHCRDCRAG
jgi:hypothetical protein